MNAHVSRRSRGSRIRAILLGLLVGAAVGFVIGLTIAERLAGGIFLGAVGGVCGGIVGGRIIRTTGWCMIAGAAVGGTIAVLSTHIGKMVLYGAPWGAVVGLVVGLVVEKAFVKRRGPDKK